MIKHVKSLIKRRDKLYKTPGEELRQKPREDDEKSNDHLEDSNQIPVIE